MTRTLGWLLGIENVASIDRIDVAFAAPWAQDKVFWVFLIAIVLLVGSLTFYLRLQEGRRWLRLALGIFRGILLALLLVTLADPVLQLNLVNRQRPLLYVAFDGTDSMAI